MASDSAGWQPRVVYSLVGLLILFASGQGQGRENDHVFDSYLRLAAFDPTIVTDRSEH